MSFCPRFLLEENESTERRFADVFPSESALSAGGQVVRDLQAFANCIHQEVNVLRGSIGKP